MSGYNVRQKIDAINLGFCCCAVLKEFFYAQDRNFDETEYVWNNVDRIIVSLEGLPKMKGKSKSGLTIKSDLATKKGLAFRRYVEYWALTQTLTNAPASIREVGQLYDILINIRNKEQGIEERKKSLEQAVEFFIALESECISGAQGF